MHCNPCEFQMITNPSINHLPVMYNQENGIKCFRGETSCLCANYTIHWKTVIVHQAEAVMYHTQQMIQGENFHDWLKNLENLQKFPPRNILLCTVFTMPVLEENDACIQ